MEIFERVVALIFFILFFPVFVIIGILIFLFEPFKPVIYKGVRIGRFGKPFIMYKFRTLKINAEKIVGKGLLNDKLNLYTPIGKILRYLKLDELPQLLNVIKGDMSFIGPRPDRPIRFYENLINVSDYEKRLYVKPGMSGIAQMEGDYYSLPEEKLQWDLIWINNGNTKVYFKYFFMTIFYVLHKLSAKLSPLSRITPWVSIALIITFKL